MNQAVERKPAPVTQRDGSKLQNSNCRMASISTGLDFHTVGAKRATGGRMRSFTSDQTGGTGSDDAKEAWTKGYSVSLTIKDGAAWSGVVLALREGRGVNLDVWHAYLTSGCISGEGRYGHNIFVLPDFDGKWLASDPWCKPAKWQRISETELRKAAEKWGAVVRTQTGLASPSVQLLQRAARELMDRWRPEQEAPEDPDETEIPMEGEDTGGGYVPVMFTTTNRQPVVREEEEMTVALFGTGNKARTYPKGTPVYDAPGGKQVGTIASSDVVYTTKAQDKATDPDWFLIDGGSEGGTMRWVKKT